MPNYLIHETMLCEVTFVRRIKADNENDAYNGAVDGDGDLLGVSVGDAHAGVGEVDVKPDHPLNIPTHFYREPEG